MLSVIYAECRYAKCHKDALFAECRYAECRGADKRTYFLSAVPSATPSVPTKASTTTVRRTGNGRSTAEQVRMLFTP